MQVLTTDQARTWCVRRAIDVDANDYLYFKDGGDCHAIDLAIPPSRLVGLTAALLPYSEMVPFEGALVWIRQWGVWVELIERVGFRTIEMLRLAHGFTNSMRSAPGLLFEPGEELDLQIGVMQPLLVGWDAFLVPASGAHFVAIDHDGVARVIGRTPEIHRGLLSDLQPWAPQDDAGRYSGALKLR